MTQRIAIIGAGPGGLASAMLLSAKGLSVDVYEREPEVGGRTRTWEQDGYRFDLGPTFFLYPRILQEIFETCGKDFSKEVPMLQLSPQYRLSFEGRGHIDATPDVDEMEAQIAKIAPGQEGGFRRFMEDNRSKLEKARPILERAFPGFLSLLSPDVLRAVPKLNLWSVDRELKKYFSDPLIRIAFSFQSKYLGMSPYQCPSLFTILAFLEYEYGIHHPIGGFGEVSNAMQRVAEEQGARFHLGTSVERIEFEGRKARAVHSSLGRQEYDAIVVNGDFAGSIPGLIPDELRSTWSDRKIERSDYSCSTFMLYLGIEGVEEDLPHHTIVIPDDYVGALECISPKHELHDNPPFYIQNACVSDPGQAPEGHSTLYILVPVTHQTDGVDWEKEAAAYRERILDQVEAFGVKNLRSRIRTERMITPKDWEFEHGVYRGAVFNLAHSMTQMLHFRPGNRFRDVDGVYLVGGGTHPGSGLPVIYESARISSGLLFSDLGVADEPIVAPSSPLSEATEAPADAMTAEVPSDDVVPSAPAAGGDDHAAA